MEQTLEGGEKHLDFLKALCREAFPDFEYVEHALDHERDLFLMRFQAADGRRKTVGWTRMVLFDTERLPALVENPVSPLKSRILAFLQARASRPDIVVTFRHLEDGWTDTPEPRKEKRRGRRGGREGRDGRARGQGQGQSQGQNQGQPGGRGAGRGREAGPPAAKEAGRSGRPGGRGGGRDGAEGQRPREGRPAAGGGRAATPGSLSAAGAPGAPAAADAAESAGGESRPGGRRRRFRRRRRGRGGSGGATPGSSGGAPAGPGAGGHQP